jgi:hypothetical protein
MEYYKICNKQTKKRSYNNYENSADTFIDHFLSIADRIVQSIRHSDTCNTNANANNNPMHHLSEMSPNPYPHIKFNSISTGEIESIIFSWV